MNRVVLIVNDINYYFDIVVLDKCLVCVMVWMCKLGYLIDIDFDFVVFVEVMYVIEFVDRLV